MVRRSSNTVDRYGAAGPSAFDCSGLVTWAYRSGGTSLPRSSRAMSQVGTAVPRSALQPGDLVFFYRPVSHVAIYIGNGINFALADAAEAANRLVAWVPGLPRLIGRRSRVAIPQPVAAIRGAA